MTSGPSAEEVAAIARNVSEDVSRAATGQVERLHSEIRALMDASMSTRTQAQAADTGVSTAVSELGEGMLDLGDQMHGLTAAMEDRLMQMEEQLAQVSDDAAEGADGVFMLDALRTEMQRLEDSVTELSRDRTASKDDSEDDFSSRPLDDSPRQCRIAGGVASHGCGAGTLSRRDATDDGPTVN